MGAHSLSKELGISVSSAKEFIQNYYEKFPKIIHFIESQKLKAQKEGFVETLFGRRLHLPNIHSTNQLIRSEAERVAVNMPIQGTAADIIKIAMINIHEAIKNEDRIKMIIQVHDELVFEIHQDLMNEWLPKIKSMMENTLPSDLASIVNLEVEAGQGKNWAEAH